MGTTRPLTETEYATLKAALGGRMAKRDRCLVEMMRRGGFRISELLSLRLGDVVEQGQIVPEVAVARRHTKGKRHGYSVVLHAEARAALTDWVSAMIEGGRMTEECYLFPAMGYANRPMTRQQTWGIIRRAAKSPAAHLPGCVGNHSLRKSFGMDIYERSGRDIRATQEALRHVSLDSTLHYLPVSKERVNRLIMGEDETAAGGAQK
jgi:site-specific recombinase XerD